MKRLKDLREKFYSCTHEVPKIEEKPQVEEQVPTTVEIPQATATEEEISEPEEEQVTREEEPKTPTFVEKLVRKLKDLMEEE